MKDLLNPSVRIYMAVVECGSITAAADQLAMGKSSVSERLRLLEEELGAQLLVRTTRKQQLTTIGAEFYQHCRQLSDAANEALEATGIQQRSPSGPLRITAPHALVEHAVAPALAELTLRYPKLEPELIITDERLDLVEQRIDLSISIGELPDSTLKAQRVGDHRDLLCGTPERIQTLNMDTAPIRATLEAFPYIAHRWEGRQIKHRLREQQNQREYELQFKPKIYVNTVPAMLAMLKQGMGIGTLPHYVLQPHLERGELTLLFPELTPQATGIYAVHPFCGQVPVGVRYLIEQLKAALLQT